MKDAYTNAFYGIIRETQEMHGYEIPHHLEAYVVMLLAHYVDRPNFTPENSFAEAYMSLQGRLDAKQLGDTCLFVSGVFPTIGIKKGLNKSYYTNIGISSYSTAYGEIFEELATHFVFLSDFIEIAISPKHSSKQQNYNLFR